MDVAGLLRCQKGDGRRNVSGLGDEAGGNHTEEIPLVFLCIGGGGHLRHGGAWCNRIGGYSMASKLEGHLPRELRDGRLRCSIGGSADPRPIARNRREVDYAAVPLVLHAAGRALRTAKTSGYIDVQDGVEVLGGEAIELLDAQDPRAIDQNGYGAVPVFCHLEGGIDRRTVCYIQGHSQHPALSIFYASNRFLDALRIYIRSHDRHAGISQHDRCRLPDAGTGAGDECATLSKCQHHVSSRGRWPSSRSSSSLPEITLHPSCWAAT